MRQRSVQALFVDSQNREAYSISSYAKFLNCGMTRAFFEHKPETWAKSIKVAYTEV